MRPDRTFKAEFRRLRAIARSEGRDPYAPVARVWVPAAERLRRSRQPRQPFRPWAIAEAWERAVAAADVAEPSVFIANIR